ncbi:MAG TPA: MarR family transcriptional regulator [Archangium sp.]|uniref:MarR family winged helix-turn-helix transcriptional regulator n=1 Tax=Archangium sp. TaxID=1872627 RepID=UPI002E379F75|nr:MarR family transcriptional regulator [Archangium sp.]HEX5748823.1 MarR family transcriptional regulator [Archangium sp.]
MDRPRSRSSSESRTEVRGQALRTLGRRLHEASAGLMVLGDRVLAPLGVTAAQWKVLAALEADGPRRISDLVSSLRLDQAGTSRLVDRLERAGFVTRRPSKEDRREVRVVLTEEGAGAAARCRAVLEPLMRELTGELEDERLAAFAQVLEVFAARVETLTTRVPPRRPGRTPGRR